MKTKQKLLNTHINNVTMDEAITSIEKLIQANKKACVLPINVDVVMKIEKDDYLRKIVDEAELVLVDGQPLIWISGLHRKPVKARVTGSDLVPALCQCAAQKGYSIFFLGGADGVAKKAAENVRKEHPTIQIVGTYAPPFGFEKNQEELEKINTMITLAHPDILVVCFGCPKQEKWIYENIDKYEAKVSVCAGATVDFLAGTVKRAPKWMRDHGLEWLYRFFQEPKRLFKRYFIDDICILKLIFKYRR